MFAFLRIQNKRIILIFKLKITETMLQWQIVITKFKIRGFGSNQAQKEDFSWEGGGGGGLGKGVVLPLTADYAFSWWRK